MEESQYMPGHEGDLGADAMGGQSPYRMMAMSRSTVHFLVQDGCVGRLVGKKGDGLRELREAATRQSGLEVLPPKVNTTGAVHFHEVIIDVARKEQSPPEASPAERQVTISAPCEAAKYLVREIWNGVSEETHPPRILVSDNIAGAVIGKKGAGLQSLRERTGVGVAVSRFQDMPPGSTRRAIVLTGPRESTLAAALALVDTISVTTKDSRPATRQQLLGLTAHDGPTARPLRRDQRDDRALQGTNMAVGMQEAQTMQAQVHVQDSSIGQLIGKGGTGLRQIRELSGVRVTVDTETQLLDSHQVRIVTLDGDERSIPIAQALISARMSRPVFVEATQTYTCEFAISHQIAGRLIGTKGTGLRQVREATNTKVDIDPTPDATLQRSVRVSGSEMEPVKRAVALMVERLCQPSSSVHQAHQTSMRAHQWTPYPQHQVAPPMGGY